MGCEEGMRQACFQPFLCVAGVVKWARGKSSHTFIKILEQITTVKIKQRLSTTTSLEATKYCKEGGLFVSMSKI